VAVDYIQILVKIEDVVDTIVPIELDVAKSDDYSKGFAVVGLTAEIVDADSPFDGQGQVFMNLYATEDQAMANNFAGSHLMANMAFNLASSGGLDRTKPMDVYLTHPYGVFNVSTVNVKATFWMLITIAGKYMIDDTKAAQLEFYADGYV